MNAPSRERRWLVVFGNGRHVTLGRDSDPAEEELADTAVRLEATGEVGWLVLSEGRYYRPEPATLMLVRRLTKLDGDWAEAERLWHAARVHANETR